MQYRLSTIFLVFFVTATSLALFGAIGLWVAFVLCIAVLAFNKAETVADGGYSGIFHPSDRNRLSRFDADLLACGRSRPASML